MFTEGEKYMICLPQGWVLIGQCVGSAGVFATRFKNAHYIVNTGGQPWGILASDKKARRSAVFRPVGKGGECLIGTVILWACEWSGELP